jgi:mannose-6-phosphate isomerase-like protein (cupin superfamily)
MPYGGNFRHSENHRTIFAADELYYVLSGTLVLSNPQTGEIQKLEKGEAAFFRRDTWHHGFNYGQEPLRVIEFFAPPPSQGTSSAYAKTKPYLTEPRYVQDELVGKWPMARGQASTSLSMVREKDILWRMEGKHHQTLVGLLFSSDQLTVGKRTLLPGQQSETEVHGGDESVYLAEGNLAISVDTPGASPWYELHPGDGFYLPQGAAHQYRNISDKPATLLFGVAPAYFLR